MRCVQYNRDMDWRGAGKQAALSKLGFASTHPLMKGVKVSPDAKGETSAEEPAPAPVARVWPPPPHATSGTLLNPKVAAQT